MVNVIPMANKAKISSLTIDSDLDMGEYDVTATDLKATGNLSVSGNVTSDINCSGNVYAANIKSNWTINPVSSTAGMAVTINTGDNITILNMPPNQTISGTIRLSSLSSMMVQLSCFNVHGLLIGSAVNLTTSAADYTVQSGTNRLVVRDLGSTNTVVTVYEYTIA